MLFCVLFFYIRRAPKKLAQKKARINNSIRADVVRVIGENGENIGIVPLRKALEMSATKGLDLIEITEKAKPPVVKIADYGKYQYEQNKLKKKYFEKDKEKGNINKEEMKNVQIKPGTGADMEAIKSKKIKEWLNEGYKIKIDLFLFGRYKYMDGVFLKNRLKKFLEKIEGDYSVLEEMKKSSKGFSIIIKPKK